MRSPAVRLLFCGLVVLVLTSSISHLPAVWAGEPQWVEVRSPNFTVDTDAGEKRGREVALRFEQMRAVFGTLMAKVKVNLPVPLDIVAFRNSKEMRQVAPLFKGKPTEDAGLFQGGSDRSFIILDMSTENPWVVVFHEYAHQLMNGNSQTPFDPWFEEGFAEYFSSIEVDGKEVQVGRIPDDDYRILREVGMMKVADLLKVQHYSETYNESGNRRDSFYTESGMLVHYIYDNQLLPQLGNYFELKINQHMSVEQAIQEAFGMSANQFDEKLRYYVYTGHYMYRKLPAPANLSINNFTSRPLTAADANAVVADIHLHSLDYHDKAMTEFQEILKSDPNSEPANRGLGYAYLQKQDFQQAAEYFQRASQMDSKDARVHYYTALLMARQNSFGSDTDTAAMTRELEAAISLDPNFADSYALLAFAQNRSGEPEQALESMQKALAIDPRNENYRLNLASVYMTNHKMDQAIAVLKPLQNSANPEVVSRANAALANAERVHDFESSARPVTLVKRGSPEGSDTPETAQPASATATPQEKWSAPIFLSGTLRSVDCSAEPSAVLTVSSGPKKVQVKVSDRAHLILMGADQFSCSWSNKKVAVNYRQNDAGETSVISLEIQ